MAPALKHQYACNRHNPEHFDCGIEAMTLVDVVEILADWMAVSWRHADGDIIPSITVNRDCFGISRQLEQIMLNKVPLLYNPLNGE